jgi:endoglucanase Acf2
MVSKEAEERRLRFQSAKEAAGGFAGLIKQELSKKPKVYFLSDGTIVSISKEQIDLKNGWQVREFDDEQIAILENNNWNLFYVKTDPLVDNLYSIESRPLESVVVSAENNSLLLIDSNPTASDYDCMCALTTTEFTVSLSKKTQEKYSEIDFASATINGQKVLKFYFTAINDPHIMIHSEYISLKALLEKPVNIKTTLDLTQTSIYTVKAFDKYVRT